LLVLGKTSGSNPVALKVNNWNGTPFGSFRYTHTDFLTWDSCTVNDDWIYMFGSGDNMNPVIIVDNLDADFSDSSLG